MVNDCVGVEVIQMQGKVIEHLHDGAMMTAMQPQIVTVQVIDGYSIYSQADNNINNNNNNMLTTDIVYCLIWQ